MDFIHPTFEDLAAAELERVTAELKVLKIQLTDLPPLILVLEHRQATLKQLLSSLRDTSMPVSSHTE